MTDQLTLTRETLHLLYRVREDESLEALFPTEPTLSPTTEPEL